MNGKMVIVVTYLLIVLTPLTGASPILIGQGAAAETSHKAADGRTYESKTAFYNVTDERYTVGVVANVEFGTYRVSEKEPDGTERYNVEVLTMGVEVGSGIMGRVGVVEANVKTGPVEVNVGVTVDTGLLVKDGIEAKVLGVGASITKKGFKLCVFLCLGINWG